AGCRENVEESAIGAAYAVILIDCDHRAHHALEHLIAEAAFPPYLVGSFTQLTKASLHFPNCSYGNNETNQEGDNAPKTNRLSCALLNLLTLLGNLALLLS